MGEMVYDLTAAYMQVGFMGLFIIVAMILGLWWFTKGRKEHQQEREKLVAEQARTCAVIENNTAVVKNCTEVIRANTEQRRDEKRVLEKLENRIGRQGEQIDTLLTNQTVCLDRQNRK